MTGLNGAQGRNADLGDIGDLFERDPLRDPDRREQREIVKMLRLHLCQER
jgi:hypothetical protein